MSDRETLALAAELSARGEPFALATVVRREPPASARSGMKAIIRSDGSLVGWLGGACIEPTVRREALGAIRAGEPVLLVFAPPEEAGRPEKARRGLRRHPMTCHSGGTVEIYVEPQLPAPLLLLFGDSPVNRALATVAPVAGFAARTVAAGPPEAVAAGPPEAVAAGPPEASASGEVDRNTPGGRELYAVVATMGEWDEEAVVHALESGAAYVGLVASPRRARELRERLAEEGVAPAALDRLVSPAGLDLGGTEPGEIAISILAQLIEGRRGGAGTRETTREERLDEHPKGRFPPESATQKAPARNPAIARDPVCGMEVEIADSEHAYEWAGTLYYFCCSRCRRRFSRNPDEWVAA